MLIAFRKFTKIGKLSSLLKHLLLGSSWNDACNDIINNFKIRRVVFHKDKNAAQPVGESYSLPLIFFLPPHKIERNRKNSTGRRKPVPSEVWISFTDSFRVESRLLVAPLGQPRFTELVCFENTISAFDYGSIRFNFLGKFATKRTLCVPKKGAEVW